MEVGLLMVFQNFMDGITDREAYERDIHLAGLAEPLGFDTLGAVEHHFHNYAMLCDNMQFLSYMAAKTSRIKLMTGAVILPWWDPLRVVEKIIQLKEKGATYVRADDWQAFAITDGNLITGQNPASSELVARAVLAKLTAAG